MSDWYRKVSTKYKLEFNEKKLLTELSSNFNHESGAIRVYYDYFLLIHIDKKGRFKYQGSNVIAQSNQKEVENFISTMLRNNNFGTHGLKGQEVLIVQVSWRDNPYKVITPDIVSYKLKNIFEKHIKASMD